MFMFIELGKLAVQYWSTWNWFK